jgi:zinc/manganese transport system substrate-binding protein
MTCHRIVAAVAASAAALLGACTDDSHPGPQRPTVTVVASNNVYASLVEAIGGTRVHTISLITSTTEAPHRYVPTSAAADAVTSSDLLVGNGGRHDDWLAPLMRAAEHRPVALLAEQLRTPASAGSDDHYWYDLPRVAALVDGVVARLTRISPQQAETFATNAGVLREEIRALHTAITVTGRQYPGARVCLADPHPLRLVKAMGLRTAAAPLHPGGAESADLSPAKARAIQRCVEAPVRAVLLDPGDKTVAAEAMRAAALDAGIPIVDVPEVMPDDTETYPLWLGYQIDALAGALADTS